jgi:glycosyltransferase involved in cell wall biosynthesis
MRIVHVTRYDSGDGPSNAAYRLHHALLRLDVDSVVFAAEIRGASPDPTVLSFVPRQDLQGRLRRRLRHFALNRSLARYRTARPAGYEAFSDDRSPQGIDVMRQIPSGDVINVHAMFRFVDYRAFFTSVPAHTPVVRTMHDMNFFTGGCHIAAGCDRYINCCGACPQLGSTSAHDLSRQIWRRKLSALQTVPPNRLHAVSPSHWLAHEARRSRLLRDVSVSVIPLGVDTDVFSPRDKRWSREILGIPHEAHVVLFVAEPLSRPLKGFATLVEALNGMEEPTRVLLVSVGSGRPLADIRVPYLNLGRIQNDRLLSLIYSAADVVVVPSAQESFGLVCVEAMACGVPVVGSAVGGIAEIVRPGVTGALVPPHDAAALRVAVSEILRDRTGREAMTHRCREIVIEEYSLELYARRYIALYAALLDGQAGPSRRVSDPADKVNSAPA